MAATWHPFKEPNTLDMTVNRSKLVDKTFVDQSFEAQSVDPSKSIAYKTSIPTIAFTKRDDKCKVTREQNPNPKQTTAVNGSNPTDDRLCMTDVKTNDDSNNVKI